jgi:hypothetical protein
MGAATIGAIAASGGRTYIWLVLLPVTFFVPPAAPIATVIAVTTAHHLATRTGGGTMQTLVSYPDCGVPAQITERCRVRVWAGGGGAAVAAPVH